MRVLAVNAGSSSVKLRVVDDGEAVRDRDLPAGPEGPDLQELERWLRDAREVDAVAHRLVHGGRRFTAAVALDDSVMAGLAELGDLAPLHNARALEVAAAARRAVPEAIHVACFDTALHATLPDAAAAYALPREWRERWGIRRFGFHGLSHAGAARAASALLGRPVADLRLVTCHLGAGASLAAIQAGRSIDTTMGFTPNDGLIMATRSGSVDPSALTWLMRHAGLDAAAVELALETRSGLLGLSGRSARMEELLAAAGEDAAARLAVDAYLHRLRAGIAAMAAALGGVDALVFTGGVGERSPEIRARACAGLSCLGVAVDEPANARAGVGPADLSAPGSPARVLVVPAREELEMARQTESLLGGT